MAARDTRKEMRKACKAGDAERVRQLVREGVDVDEVVRGWTPLLHAAEGGHVDVIRVLLAAKASINLPSDKGVTALFVAAQKGHTHAVVALLEVGASVDLTTKSGKHPLYVAARRGHGDVVIALLKAGASVDLAKNDGATPLCIAAQNGHTAVATSLLDCGASVDLAKSDGVTPLYIAAQNGHTHVVAALLDHGAGVDLARNDGATPVFIASRNGHTDVVATLLDSNANANLADDRGQTPIAVAVDGGRTTVQVNLQSVGALFNGVTRFGEPSVVAASRTGASSVMKACLEADDQPDSEALQQATWWSVACGRAQCFRFLLRKVPNYDELALDLPTLLCLAAHDGRLEVIEALIEHDANLVFATERATGLTAVDYAAAAGHEDVVEWFRDHGALSTQRGEVSSDPLPVPREKRDERSHATIQRTLNLFTTDGVGGAAAADYAGELLLHSSLAVDARLHLACTTAKSSTSREAVSVSASAVATSIERLVSRLHESSNGFVFSHILPVGGLGEGAYGTVQRGNYFGRDVAFKLQKNFNTSSLTVGDVTQLLEFEHEARVLAVLAEPTHRHCVDYLGVAVSPDVGIAIVTEYISGGDLRGWLSEHHHFGAVDGLEFLTGLASGLVFLHEAGVVHGDIKPENILLKFEDRDVGRVYGKLIDFGGGCPYWRGPTAHTPLYASPEQLRDQPSHADSDVFSFALVVVEVLSGERPPEPLKPYVTSPEEGTCSASAPTAAKNELRMQQVGEMWRQLPTELSSCEALVQLLVGCWSERLYSRPRTPAVFATLVDILDSFDPTRAATMLQQLDEAAPPPSGNSALITAVQYCDVEEVERLIAEGARADDQNRWRHSALHVAAAIDDMGILELLLSTRPELLEDSFGNTALDIAYEQGVLFGCCADALRVLQGAYCDCTAANPDIGVLPLHDAVARQDFGAVRVLLEGGADVNATNRVGETALHVAARLKASQVADLLSETGANVSAVEMYGRSPLHLAAKAGGRLVVRTLLQVGAAVDVADSTGWTSLMLASDSGQTDVVTALLVGGASVDQAKENGWTALMFACLKGHVDVVTALLNSGASVDQATEDGSTAVMMASQNGHTDVVTALLDGCTSVDEAEEDGWTALMFASLKGHADVVTALLNGGASVDQATEDGSTALMMASQNGHTDVVTALLNGGASIDQAKKDGWTALMLASHYGHTEIVTAVLHGGASVNQAEEDGWTALILSSEKGHTDVATALLESDASIDQAKEDGWTALMFASRNGHSMVVTLLLENAADVNVATLNGQTALMSAALFGHVVVVDTLIHAGASVNATVEKGATALFAAASKGNTTCVEKLLDACANPNIAPHLPPEPKYVVHWTVGQTALDAARENGHHDVVKLLESHATAA